MKINKDTLLNGKIISTEKHLLKKMLHVNGGGMRSMDRKVIEDIIKTTGGVLLLILMIPVAYLMLIGIARLIAWLFETLPNVLAAVFLVVLLPLLIMIFAVSKINLGGSTQVLYRELYKYIKEIKEKSRKKN